MKKQDGGKKRKAEKPVKLEEWKSSADVDAPPAPSPLPPADRVGYAVVGLGHLTLEEILPALATSEKSKLVALVSGDEEKMLQVARQYGVEPRNCYLYDDYDKLADNPDVQAIYIVLPNTLHLDYTIRGAKAGKHILCEKPMAATPDECKKMIKACDKAGVKLMIAYRMQYEPHIRYMKSVIEEGTLGNTKFIESVNGQSSSNADQWRLKKASAGGGALPDVGIYCFNTIRYLLGEEPHEVFAYTYSTPGDPLFKEVEEMVSWQMRFPSGVIANCMTHYNIHEARTLNIHFDRGRLMLDKAFNYGGQRLKTIHAEEMHQLETEIGIADVDHFATEMDHFSDCIINDLKPYTPGEEGLQDHIIMDAIYESARTGKPVKLKLKSIANTRGRSA
ncbi:Gfo/Idh/MocA family protein [Pedobacter sp. SYP-B3415]|uniref:Gfo/Idh/MocA family protein n=1 Tax=Pedobacter sp. SYP-B3415 TaxID=2496641 RepID=UPI00101C2BAA|nr:Gfo/Idh/MocA family oxidoreductase [Pedobacter sp. SYP-B3415]